MIRKAITTLILVFSLLLAYDAQAQRGAIIFVAQNNGITEKITITMYNGQQNTYYENTNFTAKELKQVTDYADDNGNRYVVFKFTDSSTRYTFQMLAEDNRNTGRMEVHTLIRINPEGTRTYFIRQN